MGKPKIVLTNDEIVQKFTSLNNDVIGFSEKLGNFSTDLKKLIDRDKVVTLELSKMDNSLQEVSTAIAGLVANTNKSLSEFDEELTNRIKEGLGKKVNKKELQQIDFIHLIEAIENENRFPTPQQGQMIALRVASLRDFMNLLFPPSKS